jgi:hypothetical protein
MISIFLLEKDTWKHFVLLLHSLHLLTFILFNGVRLRNIIKRFFILDEENKAASLLSLEAIGINKPRNEHHNVNKSQSTPVLSMHLYILVFRWF